MLFAVLLLRLSATGSLSNLRELNSNVGIGAFPDEAIHAVAGMVSKSLTYVPLISLRIRRNKHVKVTAAALVASYSSERPSSEAQRDFRRHCGGSCLSLLRQAETNLDITECPL